MKRDSIDKRNRTTPAISEVSAMWPNGIWSVILALRCWFDLTRDVISVFIYPGEMQFDRTPNGPYSSAIERESAITPAFEDE